MKQLIPDTPVHTIVFNYSYGEDVTKDNIHGEILGYVIGHGKPPNTVEIHVTHFRYNHSGAPWITEPDKIKRCLDEVHIRGADFNPQNMAYTDLAWNFTDVTFTVLKRLVT